MDINEEIALGFELQNKNFISREMLQEALSVKIDYMLKYQMEELFSKLYRLDIFEKKIKAVIAEGDNIGYKIAGLIIDRQIEKQDSKMNNPSEKPKDKDLEW
ncbi:MAG TPA: hypothetical protein PKX92_02000 [Edaphocola sp.]|nr:hypothetical protein [Edaphocola sp.]